MEVQTLYAEERARIRKAAADRARVEGENPVFTSWHGVDNGAARVR